MASNQLSVPGSKKKFVDITSVLNNESQKRKLQNYIDETLLCKTKILDQQESIKTLRQTAVDELGIEPKMFNTIVALYFNNNFDEKLSELEHLQLTISALMQTTK